MNYKGMAWDIEKYRILDRLAENDCSIEKTLVRRGFTFQSREVLGATKKLMIDSGIFQDRDKTECFFNLMHDGESRKLIRWICFKKQGIDKDTMTQEGFMRIDKTLNSLLEVFAVEENNGLFRARNEKVDFGPNFEWYVAELFKREFACTSDWGVHIVEAPDGGDYDVLARSENNIIYLECKAKQPSKIKEDELVSFLKRDEFLRPYVSFILVDSSDSLSGLEKRFNRILRKVEKFMPKTKFNSLMKGAPYTERIGSNFFHLQNRLFVINSNKSIVENIKLCLRHRHRIGELNQAHKGRFWLHKLLLAK